jgi:protein-L-isoaspartate O-methyltransferase
MTRRDLLLLTAAATAARAQENKTEKLAPYYPTPELIVERMLQLGELKAGEKMFDLGSGDGRIVLMAAKKFGGDAVGVELDEDLVHRSRNAIRKAGLEKTAHIIQGDILLQDYSSADLVTVYLLPIANDKMRPVIDRQLRKGARLVAHDFQFSNWTPEKVVDVEDDGEGRSHTLYLYRVK